MSTTRFDELDTDIEECTEAPPIIPEASPSTKLARRRKIEDLFEEKRLRDELAEFGQDITAPLMHHFFKAQVGSF